MGFIATTPAVTDVIDRGNGDSGAFCWQTGHRGGEPMAEMVTVLLVDDDIVDVAAIRCCFCVLEIANPLVTARDGVEALEMLRGEGGHTKLQPPYLIVTDINMPRMGGLELLAELRADPALRGTLVFVMTTSADPRDRRRAYEYNAAGYTLKHRPEQSFVETIGALALYWRSIAFPVPEHPAG